MEHLCLAKVVQRVMPMAVFATTIYLLILLLEVVGFYKLEATHPLLLISYPTVLHLFALPLLAFALFGFHRFLFLYLCLNGFWIVSVIVLVFCIYMFFEQKVTQQWKKDPAHHMLLFCFFVTSVMLQILVHLLMLQCKELERRVKLKKEQIDKSKKEKNEKILKAAKSDDRVQQYTPSDQNIVPETEQTSGQTNEQNIQNTVTASV